MSLCVQQNQQENQVVSILNKSEPIREILCRAAELGLPDWYVGAGCIAQTVWNDFHGYELTAHIKDCDFVYFDSDLSEEKEQEFAEKVRNFFGHIPFEIDVVNEARVHLWYQDAFGYPIEPYRSIQEAIATFPTTATAIGVSCVAGRYSIQAPYGVHDLLSMVVRANKKQITEEIYLKKVDRWKQAWPQLAVIPWDSNGEHYEQELESDQAEH